MIRSDTRAAVTAVTAEAPVKKVKKGMSQPTKGVSADNTVGNGAGSAGGKNHMGHGERIGVGKNHMGW